MGNPSGRYSCSRTGVRLSLWFFVILANWASGFPLLGGVGGEVL